MKIPKNFDVCSKEPPSFDKGTAPESNPGIQPTKIKDTPGENATNMTAAESTNKKQPFGKGGAGGASSGYTN